MYDHVKCMDSIHQITIKKMEHLLNVTTLVSAGLTTQLVGQIIIPTFTTEILKGFKINSKS